jgi:hypothetical protein
MSARAGFWATFLVFVAAAAVALQVSGLQVADIRHLGTPRNALLDGDTEVRVPIPPPTDGRLLPAVPISTTGTYAFMFEEQGEPIRFDPCQPIRYVYNGTGEPAGLGDLIVEAVQSVSTATGLQFTFDGSTDEVANFDRRLFQPDRYGEGFAPLVIGWSNESAMPELAGSITGLGGSSSVTGAYGDDRFLASGTVVLDTEDIAGLLGSSAGRTLVRAVIMHEIAHVVGLAHVDDSTEIMNATNTFLAEWGPGDLAGLAIAGRGPCEAS